MIFRTITILLFFFLILCSPVSAQKQSYKIGFLFDDLTIEVEPLLERLKNEIISVVGEDAEIIFPAGLHFRTNYDFNKISESYFRLVNEADIIISFGVYNSTFILQQPEHLKPTLIVDTFPTKISGFADDKKTSGIHNLTYFVIPNSFSQDFKIFKEIVDFKNIGIVVEKPLNDILELEPVFEESLENLESEFKIITYDTISDILESLNGIDSIYFAGGFFITDDEIRVIARELIKRKIPSLSSVRKSHVDNGILAASITDDNFDQFMRRISLTVESYVNGTNFSESPVFFEFNSVLSLNYNTAKEIDVPLRYSFIGDTNFVGGDINRNPSAEVVYDLPTVIETVLENNLSLKSSFKNVDLSKQDIKIAKSDYLPDINVSANSNYVDPDLARVSSGNQPEFSTYGIVSLNQTLFSEDSNANIGISKSLARAQREGFNTDVLDTIFDAANSYFNILILKSNVGIQLTNLELTNKNLEIAEENFEAGLSGKSDMLRFRSEKSQNTQSLVEAINQMEKGYVALNQLLNNPYDYEIDVNNVSLDDDIFKRYNYDFFIEFLDRADQNEVFVEFLVNEALNNAPELKFLSHNLDATERSIKLFSRRRYFPLVTVEGQYNNEFSRSGKGTAQTIELPEDSYNVMLNITFPIFSRNLNVLSKQRSIIQKKQIEYDMKNTELVISSNVKNSVLDLVNQISNIELSAVSEQAANEALELTQASYSEGAVNIVQLLDAQNNYLEAQLAKSNAVYNYLIKMLQLERTIGYYFLVNSEEDNLNFRNKFLNYMKENIN